MNPFKQKTVEEIVAPVQKIAADLKALAERNRTEARIHTDTAAKLSEQADSLVVNAARADKTAANIEKLFAV